MTSLRASVRLDDLLVVALVWVAEIGIGVVPATIGRPIAAVVWVLGLAVVVSAPGSIPSTRGPVALLFAWAGWYLVSTLWAGDPGSAQLTGLGLVSTVAVAVRYVDEHGLQRLLVVVAAAGFALLAGGVLLEAVAPSEAGRFIGLGKNPTDSGRTAAVSALAALGADPARFRRWLPVYALAALVIVRADARTAALGLAVGTIALAARALTRRARLLAVGGSLIGALLIAGGLATGRLRDVVARDTDGEDLDTLTGRTDLWPHAVEWARDDALIGIGATASADRFRSAEELGDLGWNAFNAHNALLQNQLELGVVGSVLLLATLLPLARRRIPHEGIGVALALGVNGFTEALVHVPSLAVLSMAGLVAATFPGPTVPGARRRPSARRRRSR